MHPLHQALAARKSSWVAFRRDLHQHPEIGFDQFRTRDLVASQLEKMGFSISHQPDTTGVIATLRAGTGDKVLAIRAEMDALPLQEESGKAWSSKTTGKFHGCGHDGHVAILLCAAEYLAEHRPFDGTLHLIFQPAAELLYGSRVMLAEGLFAQFPCDAVFALHTMPGLPEGAFHFRSGAMMASCDTLNIEISASGGQADASLTAAQIKTFIVRKASLFGPSTIIFGEIQSDSNPGQLSRLKLRVGKLDPQRREQLLHRIEDEVHAQAKKVNTTARVRHINGCPVLFNAAEETAFAISVARELVDESLICTDTPPLTRSEDFAFMLDENPQGAYLMIGAGEGPMLHHPAYDFNDELIIPAAAYWCLLARRFLATA
ncbi:amidohydrolase [Erwinia mallotivora]|uniref:amidohydrolase n=1 Tax=Erwinia mallotivora TaxID=69222 RepID=UPI0021BECE02|nr:amidohydrolase [Erwinia mallotivora]